MEKSPNLSGPCKGNEMRGAREITGAIFAGLEMAHAALRTFTTDWSNVFQPPDVTTRLIDHASWLAFIAFAAVAFRRFSYRWLRTIAAFLALLLLPIVALLLFGRYGGPILEVIPIDWMATLPAIMQIAVPAMQLGIAGFVYRWSVRRERGALAAASTNLVI
ncbi:MULTISPECIES: hypothetical protein [unclassified Bradyrhizobium]|uniref:hypothetical protein n=1 Tax=unclassified Bradyrhizobium TaxID=2631580 RepID=UPI0028EDF6AD|nr:MULTISPECIES: hypothetical protein [unclassified Bradyrhizobium]